MEQHGQPIQLDYLAIADLQFSPLILRDPICSFEEKLFRRRQAGRQNLN